MMDTDGQTDKARETKWSDLLGAFPHGKTVAFLVALWSIAFHFYGNSTFGYADSSSLFGWLHYAYSIDEENQHGYIIPFVVLLLLYIKRDALVRCPKSVFRPALVIVVVGVLLHLLGFMVQQIRVSIVGYVLGLYGITGLFWGLGWMRIAFFPFALFAFCIPLGSYADSITFPLRMVVTKLAVGFSQIVLGIDVIREGTLIFDADRNFQYDVAPACSGIRSLFALTALATVYGYLTFQSVWKRAVMIALAVPLAVLGNSIRIIAVIIAGETAGQEAGAAIEQKLGFVTFLTAMIGMFVAGRLLSSARFGKRVENYEPSVGVTPGKVFTGVSIRALGIGVVVITAGMGGFLAAWGGHQRLGEPGVRVVDEPMFFVKPGETSAQPENLANAESVALPLEVGDYRSTSLPLQEIVFDKLPRDTVYGQRRYTAPDQFFIDNLVVLMGTDRTSIHQPQYCLTGSGWRIDGQEFDSIEMHEPMHYNLPVMKLRTSRNFKTEDGRNVPVSGVYVYWFVSGDGLTARHAERMWSMAKTLVTEGELERWAYITVFAPCQPGMEELAYERIQEFVRTSVPKYQLVPRPEIKLGGLE